MCSSDLYIYLQLKDYKEGRRKNPMMSPVAAGLEKQDMHDLAAYFASQKQARTGFKTDPERVKPALPKPKNHCARCATSAAWQARMKYPVWLVSTPSTS